MSRSDQEHPRHANPNYGAHFSLSLELGFAGDDRNVSDAISSFWDCHQVEGPWADPKDIDDRRCVIPRGKRGILEPRRYGLLTVNATFSPVFFALYWIRETEASVQEPSDWLTLGIPVSALPSSAFVDDDWTVAAKPWLNDLCRALADVADHVHGRVPILVGAMGEETSGCWRLPTPTRMRRAHQEYPPLAVLSADALDDRGGFVLPEPLWRRLGPCVQPVVLSSGLLYSPPQSHANLTGA